MYIVTIFIMAYLSLIQNIDAFNRFSTPVIYSGLYPLLGFFY